MDPAIWEDIKDAIAVLTKSTSLKKLEGSGWKAYWVADTLRVDIDRYQLTRRSI